jgi:hypothetical protein
MRRYGFCRKAEDCCGPVGLAMTFRAGFAQKVLVLVVLLASVVLCRPAAAELRGGCGEVNITPPLGIPLIGSYSKPSDDVLDELYAKALVLDDGTNSVVIVSCDLLYTPLEEITGPVRRIITDKLGIPEQNVLVCATHTHSGPEVFTRDKFSRGKIDEEEAARIDRAYLTTLVEKIASAAMLAHKHMREVRIGAAKGYLPEIVFNRRPRNDAGLVKMAFTLPPEVRTTRKVVVDPGGEVRTTFVLPDKKTHWRFGPIDPQVCVLSVEDPNGQAVGSLINFGCHPVCIYPSLPTTISADYPAFATRVVERAEGGLCLFTLGLAGDAVPLDRGVRGREQIGRAVGGEALRRLQFVPTTSDVTISAMKKQVVFPTKPPAAGEAADENKEPNSVTTEIQVLRLGDIYILGLPGEVLVEVGLPIKKRAGLDKLFVVSLSNDAIGYVCHSAAYDEGGYEPSSGTRLAKGAGEIMIKQALALIERIKSS